MSSMCSSEDSKLSSSSSGDESQMSDESNPAPAKQPAPHGGSVTPHPPSRRVVEDYELGQSLGKGHFATVKLARRLSSQTGEVCALKIIEHKTGDLFSARQQELFRREMEAMATVRHRNVVELRRVVPDAAFPHHSDGRMRRVLLLEIEYCAGGELFDFVLNGGAMPEGAARHCARELLEALAACHKAGVFHRDLKPENILVGDGYALKIGDFGLAAVNPRADPMHLNHESSNLCATPVGTRSYMAPEVVALNDTRVAGGLYDGAKADTWGAAVILFILLAGNPPFTVADRTDWWFNAVRLNRHADFWRAHQRPPCPAIAPQAMAFLNRAFRADPAERATCAQLLADPWLASPAADPASDQLEARRFMTNASAAAAARLEQQKVRALSAAKEAAQARDLVFAKPVDRGSGAAAKLPGPDAVQDPAQQHLTLQGLAMLSVESGDAMPPALGSEPEEPNGEEFGAAFKREQQAGRPRQVGLLLAVGSVGEPRRLLALAVACAKDHLAAEATAEAETNRGRQGSSRVPLELRVSDLRFEATISQPGGASGLASGEESGEAMYVVRVRALPASSPSATPADEQPGLLVVEASMGGGGSDHLGLAKLWQGILEGLAARGVAEATQPQEEDEQGGEGGCFGGLRMALPPPPYDLGDEPAEALVLQEAHLDVF